MPRWTIGVAEASERTQQSFRASRRSPLSAGIRSCGHPLSAVIGDALHVDGGGSGVNVGPARLPSGTPAYVDGDGLGSDNRAYLVADYGDASRARTASGVKSGCACYGSAGAQSRGGLADNKHDRRLASLPLGASLHLVGKQLLKREDRFMDGCTGSQRIEKKPISVGMLCLWGSWTQHNLSYCWLGRPAF